MNNADYNVLRFRRDQEDADQARALLDCAGKDYLKDMAEIKAVSEKQRQYAASARIRVLSNLWRNIQHGHRTEWFANVIIEAANRHNDARWWIDHDCLNDIYITHCLDRDIEIVMQAQQ